MFRSEGDELTPGAAKNRMSIVDASCPSTPVGLVMSPTRFPWRMSNPRIFSTSMPVRAAGNREKQGAGEDTQ